MFYPHKSVNVKGELKMKKFSRKELQKKINNYVKMEYEGIKAETFKSEKRKFRHCQASVYETENYFVLCSYDTDVAAVVKGTAIGVDFLRYVYGYTATSAQHIAKFFNDYGAKYHYMYRE